jgi:hypothetical protein
MLHCRRQRIGANVMVDMVLMTIVWPALAGGLALVIGIAVRWVMSPQRTGKPSSIDASVEADAAPWPVMLAGAIGLTLAFAISFRYTEGEWPLPPHTRWHWVFLMAITAGGVGIVNSLIPGRWLATMPRVALAGIALGLIGFIMLRPLPPVDGVTAAWPDWVWKVGFGTVVLVLWLGLESIARREHSAWLLASVIASFTAASLVIVEARFAKPAQLAGAVAATCGIAFALSIAMALVRRRLPVHCGMTAPLAMILPGLLIFGWFHNAGNVPIASFVLAGASPLALLVAALPPLRAWTGWRAWVLRVTLVTILPAIAIALTMMRETPPEPAGYEW